MLIGAAVGITMVTVPLRWIAGVLIVVGLIGFGIALSRGYVVELGGALRINQALMAMVVAVSFLQLIAPQKSSARPRLSGRAAVWRTSGAVHLLGSVINVTVVSSASDYIRGNKPLRLSDALLISRSFSASGFWSPFWAASAAALTYAPDADVSLILLCGGALAIFAIAFNAETISRRLGSRLADYQGYALTSQLLKVPVAMVVLIVVIHLLAPDVSVAKLVVVCSIGITAAVLVKRDRHTASRTLLQHAAHHVPRHTGELTLFASAGILALGLQAFLEVTPFSLPFGDFNVLTAWVSIILMIALAMLGVHPVVSIAAFAALVGQMGPDPTLFALAAMIGWGCSVCVGPMSGLLIHLRGRYGMKSMDMARGNAPYIVFVVALAYPCLLLCQALLQL